MYVVVDFFAVGFIVILEEEVEEELAVEELRIDVRKERSTETVSLTETPLLSLSFKSFWSRLSRPCQLTEVSTL